MSKNVVSLTDAESWTKNWRTKYPNNCKAFLIPCVDLIETLEEMGILQKNSNGNYTLNNVTGNDIRAYVGIDPTESEGNGEKLLIVGTELGSDGVYRDMVPERKNNSVVTLKAGQGDVYDFTRPCPNNCDQDSPLY